MSATIEGAIESEDWSLARRLIRKALKKEPDSHWLISRLGLTHYEQRQYARALLYSRKALALASDCPLVLWDHAGCLEMLDRPREALRVYQRLVRRGVERIAYEECGEGIAWARGLIMDCHYRMAGCYRTLGRSKQCSTEYARHFALRRTGCRSIYPIAMVRKEACDVDSRKAQPTEGRRTGKKLVLGGMRGE